ncbi:type II toxin-antitoxin system HicB family antitoxin [Rhizorhabdus dicambivorans]|uniref:Type II toxin-antitoxin system HicB family antitoxin n=1 Tax=Rhizorhabdus dicambivorans TaxID=1850238 RepID=A0A2A4G288_9SPHN|nr:type II toxin-antitoxin system HicB family antitoxin [Rhizorhabdus dicambivorans]ATE64860.1 type II toxin-antitoxin system HicB family antitoxin [Rhizorhabdus dicambivorans]PCE44134.1 type II toxin-antitoxin system HicB family antitoxin [Rhizorhabdus dicambivorans]
MGIYLKGLELYPALVRREGDFYQADFVDIPGCRAYGASAVEAEINAGEALHEHVATLGRYGRRLPVPSVVEQQDRDADRYVAYITAPLP